MKPILLLATITMGSAAFGQSPPDVPESHWASKAVSDLYRLGVLKGYPDGLYRGTRPVSRYEMAQAINALFGTQQDQIAKSAAEIDELRQRISSRTGMAQVDVQGLADMRRRLDSLESDVTNLETLRPQMRDLTTQFESMSEQLRKIREDLQIMRNKLQ